MEHFEHLFSYVPVFTGDNILNIMCSFHVKCHNTIVSYVNQKLNKIYKIIFYTTKKNKVIKEVMFCIKFKKHISLTRDSGALMYYVVEI